MGQALMGITAPINILLVDDEPKNLSVLEAVLTGPGYRLVRAETPDEALLALVSEEFALLILDVRMPGMNGFELARMIKERKKTANLPIIFLTAYDNEDEQMLEGYGSGAVDYLRKPVNPAVLKSKVAVFAELHRKGRESADAYRAMAAEVIERRRAEEKLRETVRDLEAFSYSIAHDMRAPLRAMAGYADIVLSEHSPNMSEEGRGYLGRIVTAAQRLDALIVDILDYSKVVRDELPLSPVNLESLVADVINSYPALAGKTVQISVQRPLPRVLGNAAALTQVLANLLGNAVKFVATGVAPKVQVRAELIDGAARVYVEDNGIGIPADAQPRLFEIFARANAPGTYEGTGIGLAIVRKAVERMGGTVGVESHEGKGSRFWFQLNRAG
jgi:signal transduction histidine kinase